MDQEDGGFPIRNTFIETTIVGSVNDIPPAPPKKKRNLPGTPDPEAEVISLSPKTLMATNRFLCEICGKGFQRDQNLQLHRRGHNLPWKLKQRNSNDPIRKRVYVCPEKTCVHHNPARALGDLTGIKKHFCRKHGEKKWKCDKCCKKYAVQSDWKAHSKTCGTREYKCDCGTVFSRRDSFITHRAFCDALAEETARVNAVSRFNIATALANGSLDYNLVNSHAFNALMPIPPHQFSSILKPPLSTNNNIADLHGQIQTQHKTPGPPNNNPLLPVWITNHQVTHPNALPNNNNVVLHQNDTAAVVTSHPQHSNFYQNPTTGVRVVSSSCSNPQQDLQHDGYHINSWFIGNNENNNKMPSLNNIITKNGGREEEEEDHHVVAFPLMTTRSVTSNNMTEELVGTSSVCSLFSNQHQQQTPGPIMSATALLQKAAQIGATSTTDHLFLGAAGNMNFNNNNNNNSTNDVHQVMRSKYGGNNGSGGSEGRGGYGGSSSTITTTANLVGSDVESTANEFSPINPADIYNNNNNNPMKRRRVMLGNEHQDQTRNSLVVNGGETRDFLGVGIQQPPICHPPSINGWI